MAIAIASKSGDSRIKSAPGYGDIHPAFIAG